MISIQEVSPMGMSNYLANEILDHIFNVGAYSAPTIYVALFSNEVGDDNSGNELSGGSYARVAHASWNAAANRLIDNNGTITFPQATGDWSAATHVALFDAATNGNLIAWAPLDTSRTALTGDQLRFLSGELNFEILASSYS